MGVSTNGGFITVGEVARRFKVTSKTVVRWCNDGKLPYIVTLGGHRRFNSDAIDKIVDSLDRPMAERP